ncbi:RES family NAD+ phosphorylase [Actinomyces slackii]|uniref:RES domain n=1 Tax=Actinomyces slackii TaxID=52774 RepID=A0A3S4SL81_9ACTO|nr:RES family NAD+ phosphorylase [Actinomyces slackii]VEG75338.1 RES domain [Actinomyces slackii]
MPASPMSWDAPKNPVSPPVPLRIGPEDIRSYQGLLWRIHRTAGEHPSAWNSFRSFGPLPTMRWDPHPQPLGEHPGSAVLYAATDLRTAAAEVFQAQRRIDPMSAGVCATTFVPARPLRLLALLATDSPWLLRHGASHSLMAAPRSTCRAWARQIARAEPADGMGPLDGLWVESTMTGRPMVVLFASALPALPDAPRSSAPLAAPVMMAALADISDSLGWELAWPVPPIGA